MGHTVWSQRINTNVLLQELSAYGKALRKEDRFVFEQLLKRPMHHVGPISHANSFHTWAFLLLSIVLEQEKKIQTLEDLYESVSYRQRIIVET